MEGYNVKCLIDSGSAVSIIPISEARRIGIEKLKKAEWLKITCANQEVIEYLEYFETDIKIFGKLVKEVGFLVSKNDILKVVGMNILNKLPEYRSEKMIFRKYIQENTCNRNQNCVKIGVNKIEVEILRDRQWMDELVYGDSMEVRHRLVKILETNEKAFMKEGGQLGWSNAGNHSIRTLDNVPVNGPYRRIPLSQIEQVREHLDKLKADGVIEESESDYCSPMVIVKKKNGEMRLCIDYRLLNKKTERDAYPMMRLDDLLDTVSGYKYYSSLDLKSAYNQINVVSEYRHKTAFTSPLGLYQFVRMPFGLVNAPATFQRIISRVFREEMFKSVVCYLDDILIFSNTIEEHMNIIGKVLEQLRNVGIQLNIKKCSFIKKKVIFLGHRISAEGIGTDPEKISAIKTWATTVKDLRMFLGFCTYYRTFVNGYSTMTEPLNKLMRQMNTKEGKPVSRSKSKRVILDWNPECERAMQRLRK